MTEGLTDQAVKRLEQKIYAAMTLEDRLALRIIETEMIIAQPKRGRPIDPRLIPMIKHLFCKYGMRRVAKALRMHENTVRKYVRG